MERWKTSFSVRPQAVWSGSVLFAVTGPSKKLHLGPPRFCSRRRSKTRSRSHHSRTSCSSATWSGTPGSGSNETDMGSILESAFLMVRSRDYAGDADLRRMQELVSARRRAVGPARDRAAGARQAVVLGSGHSVATGVYEKIGMRSRARHRAYSPGGGKVTVARRVQPPVRNQAGERTRMPTPVPTNTCYQEVIQS